ncbi:hypothetical protein SCL14_12460 [Legionella pneumophila serogroup 1]|nr:MULTISPECIES: hypothetical protein [Legionella]
MPFATKAESPSNYWFTMAQAFGSVPNDFHKGNFAIGPSPVVSGFAPQLWRLS